MYQETLVLGGIDPVGASPGPSRDQAHSKGLIFFFSVKAKIEGTLMTTIGQDGGRGPANTRPRTRGGWRGGGGGEGGVKLQRIVNVYILLLMKRIDKTLNN